MGLLSGLFGGGGDAAGDAADVQSEFNQQAIDEISRQHGISRQDLAPFRAAPFPSGGISAIDQFQALLGLRPASGGGGGGLSESQIRQNLLDSGQFNIAAQGGNDFLNRFGVAAPTTIKEANSLLNNARGRDAQPFIGGRENLAEVFNNAQEVIDASGSTGTAAGFNQQGFDTELARQLAAQGQQGQGSGDALGDAFRAMTNSPGQQFIRDRARQNLLRSSASIGGLGGGNVRSDLVQRGAGFAQQDLQNQFARLQTLINTGLGAATGTANLGAQSSGNIANLLQGSGQAQAGGILGQQQSQQQGFGNILGTVGLAAGGGFGSGIAGLFG